MTSAIQHASNIAVLWHFTIFDEFDVELLRRFHQKKSGNVVSLSHTNSTELEFNEGVDSAHDFETCRKQKRKHMHVTGMNL